MHSEVQCKQQDKRVNMHSLHRKKGHYALRTWQVPTKNGHYALRSAVQVARQKGSLCTLKYSAANRKKVIMHSVHR